MEPMNETFPLRGVVICLHPTSARLRFLKHEAGHISLPAALPALSELLDVYQSGDSAALHPAVLINQLCQSLGLAPESLAVEPSLRCWVDAPGTTIPVFCLRTVDELPFEAPSGYRWIDLPDCFSLSAVEQQMMRRIYQWLME